MHGAHALESKGGMNLVQTFQFWFSLFIWLIFE